MDVSPKPKNYRKILEREGITSARSPSIVGSTFGLPSSSPYKSRDQQFLDESNNLTRSSSSFSRSITRIERENITKLVLPQADWIELGDGWFQCTPIGTGGTTRYGLHSVIESVMNQLFLCLYQPRSQEAKSACCSSNPEYNLEVSAKIHTKSASSNIKSSNTPSNLYFQIVLAFKSISDFVSIKCNYISKTWGLISHKNFQDITIIEVKDGTIRTNSFYDLYIQIRGNYLSVDTNNIPIFTNVKMPEIQNLSGYLGLFAKGTVFAIKGWKLKGTNSTMILRNLISSSEIFDSNPLSLPLTSNRKVESVQGSKSGSLANYLFIRQSLQSNDDNVDVNQSPSITGSQDQPSKRSHNELQSCADALLSQHHEKSVVDIVMRDIIQRDLGITFDDIASLETAKRLLNEAVVLPTILPEFFTGIREPWKGVLLFGPPGTGKTLLAKAVCSFNCSTFFSCSSSSLISKFRGESEKIVRCLFEAARFCAPAIIFLDEVDALVSQRGMESEHEASRRLKTEFFSQMDGLASSKQDNKASKIKSVMVLATTNCPWDLDDAIRRRLQKRIYIPLPDNYSRQKIFYLTLRTIPLSDDVDIDRLADMTDGYSGSDIQIICKDASMMPMRRLLNEYSPSDILELKATGEIFIPKVTMEDFKTAIGNTKPSVNPEILQRFSNWEKDYSSH